MTSIQFILASSITHAFWPMPRMMMLTDDAYGVRTQARTFSATLAGVTWMQVFFLEHMCFTYEVRKARGDRVALGTRSALSFKGQACCVRPSSVKEHYRWHSCCMNRSTYVCASRELREWCIKKPLCLWLCDC